MTPHFAVRYMIFCKTIPGSRSERLAIWTSALRFRWVSIEQSELLIRPNLGQTAADPPCAYAGAREILYKPFHFLMLRDVENPSAGLSLPQCGGEPMEIDEKIKLNFQTHSVRKIKVVQEIHS